ncbi:MAG TPA: SDR family oxidoreductase [Herpetosiphonaceae bacterium]|jgi:NAD(P)-dependent dehydrogenase (short-subunit alcohol dehydrogenase family)|nr:SDR family oxidoreductase [Herpetosiphonaceae bacterium]
MARTYVITGSASGIGAATARLLKEAGNTVIGIDIRDADIVADLSTQEGRRDAAQQAVERSGGGIDAVIACAGLALPIARTVSVNYFGMTELLDALAPALARALAPRAVVVSSMASLMPNDSALVAAMLADDEAGAVDIAQRLVDAANGSEQLIYGSTKRAICRWVRRECVKPQWAGAGIPLNAVGPGIVRTPMVAEMIATVEGRAALDQLVPMPLNYYLEPENVAYLLIWLASVENTHVTGQTIYIDGGSDAVLRGDNIWDLTASGAGGHAAGEQP